MAAVPEEFVTKFCDIKEKDWNLTLNYMEILELTIKRP